MKNCLLVICCFLFSINPGLWGQSFPSVIRGQVVDTANLPVSGLEIELAQYDTLTVIALVDLKDTTDSQGFFEFHFDTFIPGPYDSYFLFTDCDGLYNSQKIVTINGDTSMVDFEYCHLERPYTCEAAFSVSRVNDSTLIFTDSSFVRNEFSRSEWDFGDYTKAYGSKSISHTFRNTGTYTVTYTIFDSLDNCQSEFSQDIQAITRKPGNCHAEFSYRVDSGRVEFKFLPQSQTFNSYRTFWTFGDGTWSHDKNPVKNYSQAGTYVVKLRMDYSFGCLDSISKQIQVNPNPSSVLSGQVFLRDSSNSLASGMVFLIRKETGPRGDSLYVSDSLEICTSNFAFHDLIEGDYLVKAYLTPYDPNYGYYLPTYHEDKLSWDSAVQVSIQPGQNSVNVHLKSGLNPGGPGFIGGLVSQGANKRLGKGIGNAQVILQKSNGEVLLSTFTNPLGAYQFDDIPYGEYQLWVEIPGLRSEKQVIYLDSVEPVSLDNEFEVSSEGIFILTSNIDSRLIEAKVYPNPMKNWLMLDFEAKEKEEIELELIDLLGKLWYEEKLISSSKRLSYAINVASLPKGSYTLIIGQRGRKTAFRIIK
ncbi:MAG: PKD domain-containing protein [Bacteroidia bacterium]|nr:PKD domain-containing protein [Bacteroidia bacterium]